MKYSYSRADCYDQCPYKFKLRYLDDIQILSTAPDADNPLIIGKALHTGIEFDFNVAKKEYQSNFYIFGDKEIEELIKLENIIEKCKNILPENGKHEIKIETKDFIGYIDLLVPTENKNEFDLYDFKYSNNVQNYLEKNQLHVYKYYFEKTTGKKIRNLYYLFAPKTQIRIKKIETIELFRNRLRDELNDKHPQIICIDYDTNKVTNYFNLIAKLEKDTVFEKKPSRLCAWCEYQSLCEKEDYTMVLPQNKRRVEDEILYKKIWLYGSSFVGKTYLANKFPSVLMLNTDGNVKFVDAPYIAIKDVVTVEGRITKRKFAWEVFEEAIEELEKKQNDFETIVVDLLNDLYEQCRVYCYAKLGIEHESDNSFKAW